MSKANATLTRLDEVLKARKNASADSSYVASLYDKGLNKILEKVGEETTEVIIAAKDMQQQPSDEHRRALIGETADLWFHTLVMLQKLELQSSQVLEELEKRTKLSGLEEKAARNK